MHDPMRAVSSAAAIVLLGVAGSGPALAQGTSETLEWLTEPSGVEIGCFDPCACPVLFQSPLSGSFRLVFTGFDGLYDHYDVLDIDWQSRSEQGPRHVRGRGTYRIGGEFALSHQLTLAVQFDAEERLRTFDSGLVPGGGEFPAIRIEAFAHAPVCFDTAIHVVSKPVGSTGVEGDALLSAALSPNPFASRLDVRFGLTRATRVDVAVLDVAGRRVADLHRGPLSAGEHTLTWDGRRTDGSKAGPGIYWVRMVGPRVALMRRAVKLD